jgi:Uma2 family endonuclease
MHWEHNRFMRLELAEEDTPPATVSMKEYLARVWRPDCDFVDGRTEDRNVGKLDHSVMVGALLWMLTDPEKPWRVLPLPSLRMRVSATRVRVADVCIVRRESPDEQILTHPPLAVIEVIDDEDRFSATVEKLDDYLQFGIENIWTVHPRMRQLCRYISIGLEKVVSGEVDIPDTPIRLNVKSLFAELDRP